MPVAMAEGADFPGLPVVTLMPQWLHVRSWRPPVLSLQASRRDPGRTSSWDSDLPQSITPGTDASADDPPELEEAGVGTESAGVVAPAAGDAAGDAAADAGDVAWVEAGPEADEPGCCEVHPTVSTPATARAVPVSNVRRAAILVVIMRPLSTSTVHCQHCPRQARRGAITSTPPGPWPPARTASQPMSPPSRAAVTVRTDRDPCPQARGNPRPGPPGRAQGRSLPRARPPGPVSIAVDGAAQRAGRRFLGFL